MVGVVLWPINRGLDHAILSAHDDDNFGHVSERARQRAAADTAADADAMNASKMANYGTRVPPHCRDRDEEGVIRPGCHVNIKGLQGRTDLNGKMGIVGHYFDAEKLRWAVEMADTGEGVKVRPSNICVAPSQPAGVSSAEEWLKAVVPEGMKFPPKLSTDEAQTEAARAAAKAMTASMAAFCYKTTTKDPNEGSASFLENISDAERARLKAALQRNINEERGDKFGMTGLSRHF